MGRGIASFVAAAALVATLSPLACGGGEQAPGEEAGKLGAVFTDARHGYRLSYPAGWTLADHSGTGRMIRADISQGKTAGLQIRVLPRAAGSLEDQADRYTRSFREEMVSHWGGSMEELDRGVQSLGANRVFWVSFHAGRRQGGDWLLVNCLVPHGDGAIVFQCGAPFEDRDSYAELFEAIVSSLESAGPG